ncbi:MAG TPA: thermonuclease family protein [Candidatus Saccharimonadales bacterium]|nr:thermonuclease family protein [Candidatus Saccharimonadales bacterium]
MKRFKYILVVVALILVCEFLGIYILKNLPKLPTLKITNESSESTQSTQSVVKGPLYNVIKVVDGDTFDVVIENKNERVRLIGINAPETVDPVKPIECYGNEASQKLKKYLTGQQVSLQADVTQANRDVYNRLLRYVFLPDGTFINEQMIRQGFAYEYTYKSAYIYRLQFKADQIFAQKNNLGLWGAGCSE